MNEHGVDYKSIHVVPLNGISSYMYIIIVNIYVIFHFKFHAKIPYSFHPDDIF